MADNLFAGVTLPTVKPIEDTPKPTQTKQSNITKVDPYFQFHSLDALTTDEGQEILNQLKDSLPAGAHKTISAFKFVNSPTYKGNKGTK